MTQAIPHTRYLDRENAYLFPFEMLSRRKVLTVDSLLR